MEFLGLVGFIDPVRVGVKEAIAKSGMGKDLNRPLTEDEKELLKKTGKLEFTETLDMKTLNVKKEVKN